MRILVIDDSEDWRDLTEAALKGAGFHDVRSVGSADEAFKQLRLDTLTPNHGSSADLIILDVMMPGLDGVEACAQIRNHPNHADVPIIMLTVADDVNGLANAFAAGATDYIAKPFNRMELLARVRSALNTKAELDRRRAREDELIALAQQGANGVVSRWIDSTTGLFTGEIAEAYIGAMNAESRDEQISVLALAIDRWEALKTACGEDASEDILSRVAEKVADLKCAVRTIAAIYLDEVIIIVAPRLTSEAGKALAESLRAAIAELGIAKGARKEEPITVSVGAITARMGQGIERQLIAGARTALRTAAANSGNRVVAVDLSC
jgi:diguanylate cyclase (GGDEF)-like protein